MRFFSLARLQKADPTTSAEAARLERLLSGMERDVAAAFRRFVRDSTSEDAMAEISDLIERGDVQGALEIIGSHIRVAGTVIPQIYQDAAIAEAASLGNQINAAVGISFDVGEPVAAALMRQNQLEFVQALTDSQVSATRQALALGLDRGQGFAAQARTVRDSIGLAPSQVEAVANYRRLLEQGSAQALQRQMRDMRFDRTVQRAIDTGTPLKPEQIDRMVERYRQTSLATRATTIARTEGVKTLSQAQEQAWRQVMVQSGIRDDDVEQTWHTNMDGRERFTHAMLNGQVRPLGVPFQSVSGALLAYPGDPRAPASEVINCRCRRSFRIKFTPRAEAA